MTVYSKKGKPYELDGVYCRHCFETSSSEEETAEPIPVPEEAKTEEVKESPVKDSPVKDSPVKEMELPPVV